MPVFADNIEMKYPSRTSGESYVLPSDIYTRHGIGDKWDAGRIILTGQDSVFVNVDANVIGVSQNNDVRIYIATSDLYKTSVVETDRAKILLTRFMQSQKDWHNIEITVVFRYNGGNDSATISIGARGGLQEAPCEGFAYRAVVKLNATGGALSKQQFYPSGNSLRNFITTKLGTSIKHKFIALKFCVYDVDINGNPTLNLSNAKNVKVELYSSLLGSSPLRKLSETIDIGNWGDYGVCGGIAGDIGLWGGPLSFIQWGGGASIDIQSITVREIDPSKNFDTSSGGNQTFPPSGQPTTNDPDSDDNTTNLDDYGVLKIYKSKTNGNKWYPPLTGMLSDSRFHRNGANITHNNGVYTVNGTGRVHMVIYSTKLAKDRGENFEFDTFDYSELQTKGTWDSPSTDWKNIEVTLYARSVDIMSDDESFAIVARSVNHDTDFHDGCGGGSLHGLLRFSDGAARVVKEEKHVNYAPYQTSDKKLGNVEGKKIGVKFCVYNLSATSVKLEVWFDKDANNTWVLYKEYTDSGNWGDAMTDCGATTDGAAITWGSPQLNIKFREQKIEFSKFSIREIIPSDKIGDLPTGGGGTGSVSRVFSKYTGLYNLIVDSSGFTCSGAPAPGETLNELTGLTVTTINDDKPLAGTFAAQDDRTQCGWWFRADSLALGTKPKRFSVYLKKVGSPTGTCDVKIRDASGNIIHSYPTLDVSTLTTSYVLTDFTDMNAPASMSNGIISGWTAAVNYTGGDSSNYIVVGINTSNPVDSSRTAEFQWETDPGPGYSFNGHTSRDMAGKIYT